VTPTIAPDFDGLLPKHTAEELRQLEANILADPDHERFPPIIVWANQKNIILDGHNQFRLRTKHRLKIRFAKIDFDSRDEALAYSMQVQLGRRNLDASAMAMILSKLPKGTDKSAGDQLTTATREQLAQEHGISRATMQRADRVREQAAPAVVKATGDIDPVRG
jgi:hypothetical protein